MFGLNKMARCFTRPKKYDGARFVVVGEVDECMGIPAKAERVIGATPGDAARFRVTRTAFDGEPFYATVFTSTSEHSDQLDEQLDTGKTVAVVVRVVFAPPTNEKKAAWSGFTIFEDDTRPRVWGLVMEEFLPKFTLTQKRLPTAA